MARILVTGVDGFTGQHLAPLLAAQGHEVHGLVRSPELLRGTLPPGVSRLHAGDLLDPAGLALALGQAKPQKVVHLAGIANVAHGDVGALYRTNCVGTFHLLKELERAGSIDAVLLASSANVYGNTAAAVLDESVPAAPANDYAFSKWAMECCAATFSPRLPITIVRPFNYTGRGQSTDFLLPKIVSHFARRAAVLELGNLDVERDFSDVRTVVDCYGRLLNQPQPGRVLNVCSGQGHSLRSVLELAAELSGHQPEIRVNPAFVRANEVKRLVGSKLALEQAIGPVQGPSLRETLAWMLT